MQLPPIGARQIFCCQHLRRRAIGDHAAIQQDHLVKLFGGLVQIMGSDQEGDARGAQGGRLSDASFMGAKRGWQLPR